MTPFLPLETERLRLRPWRVSDAAVSRELWAERDPRVPPHRRLDAQGHPTLAELETSIRDMPPPDRIGLLVVESRERCEVLGYCGLISSTLLPQDEPELAYELLRRHQGRGCATEAAQAVLDWARSSGHPRLWATVRDWNEASLRVLQKLGFERTARVEPDPVHGDSLFLARGMAP